MPNKFYLMGNAKDEYQGYDDYIPADEVVKQNMDDMTTDEYADFLDYDL